MIYQSVSELIGGTPLVQLNRFSANRGLGANLLAKLEYFNPAGSVKDRVAFAMLDAAEAEGKVNKDTVIIEPTSGNTGIGLAAAAASRGLKIILTMPETMSIERRKLLQAYGAEIVLTDGKQGMKGAIAKAEELAKENPNSFIPSQFSNPVNPQAHFKTTGPEIWLTPRVRWISLLPEWVRAVQSPAWADSSNRRILRLRSSESNRIPQR